MAFLLAALGLVIGSFLNVLIWRLNNDDSPKWWQGRSICPRCKKKISWYDNIPLLSFVLLSGRCRSCHRAISWQYPIVELVTVVSFVLIGPSPLLLVLAAVFIVIFFSDWIYGLIPDEMVAFGMAVGLIGGIGHVWMGIISGLVFLAIVVATRFAGMGLGDVKLAFLIGFLLGWPKTVVAFWVAFIIGGVAALFLLALKRVKFSDKIAFGPYLVLGTVLAALWSNILLSAIP